MMVRRELRQKVIEFDGTSRELGNICAIGERLAKSTDGVVATAPYIQAGDRGISNRRLAPMIRGVDPAQKRK